MKPTSIIAFCSLFVGLVGCTKFWGGRTPASGKILPPAKPAGVEHAPADEPPIAKSADGFVRSEPPASTTKKKVKNKVYRGTSD